VLLREKKSMPIVKEHVEIGVPAIGEVAIRLLH
jgi:hypothetical protein